VEVTDDVSKLFQASAAAAVKARPPIVGCRVDGVSSFSVAADHKCRCYSMSGKRFSLRVKYNGASPWQSCYVKFIYLSFF
jgi:carboxypeptidase C (cathepsin A)